MPDAEQAFARLLGRQPTAKEVQNLYRVKDALDLRDNDALWLVLMALEAYDTLYRQYPAMVSAEIDKSLAAQRAALATMAEAEMSKALHALARAVQQSGEASARRLAHSRWIVACGMLMAAMLVFGAYCMVLGYVLASGAMPWWAEPSARHASFALVIFAAVARAPAGTMACALALCCALAATWQLRRASGAARPATALAALLLAAIVLLLALPLWY